MLTSVWLELQNRWCWAPKRNYKPNDPSAVFYRLCKERNFCSNVLNSSRSSENFCVSILRVIPKPSHLKGSMLQGFAVRCEKEVKCPNIYYGIFDIETYEVTFTWRILVRERTKLLNLFNILDWRVFNYVSYV